jgi:hypothetical protein
MNELLAKRAYSEAAEAHAQELTELLAVQVRRDDAVAMETMQAALDAIQDQERYHRVWHRIWGVNLKAEMIETARRLAALLEGEQALLVWGRSRPVGFLVPVSVVLCTLPQHIELSYVPQSYGAFGINATVRLVADDGASGLLLACDHWGMADEYELRSWGRYARSVAAAG